MPLWTSEGNDDELPISSALDRDLRAWQSIFNEHFHHDHGWESREARQRYEERAPDLARRLAVELGDQFIVHADLWPGRKPWSAEDGFSVWIDTDAQGEIAILERINRRSPGTRIRITLTELWR